MWTADDCLWTINKERVGEVLRANLAHKLLFNFLIFKDMFTHFYLFSDSVFFNQILKGFFFFFF